MLGTHLEEPKDQTSKTKLANKRREPERINGRKEGKKSKEMGEKEATLLGGGDNYKRRIVTSYKCFCLWRKK